MSGQQIGYRCIDCAQQWNSDASNCPNCGSTRIGRLFGVMLHGKVNPCGVLEAVADNPHDGAETIQYLSAAGGRSDSTLSADRLELTMKSPIDLGRQGEGRVIERVIDQLRRDGRQINVLDSRDDRGEDCKVLCDGEIVTLQVVAVPPSAEFLGKASRGSASTNVSVEGAAGWVHDVVTKKQNRYPASERRQILLAIDARAVGVLVSTAVVSAIDSSYGNICEKSGFGAVWLVGPSDSRCTRLGSSCW